MTDVFICDYIRTPIGRHGGTLAKLRTDDLAALPLAELMKRNTAMDPTAIEEVWMGCANQAGEDNRNVARMGSLLAGLPDSVPGVTVNRLCGSGMEAVISGVRAIKAGEMELVVAGGVESMSRAPFVLLKSESAFSRSLAMEDTTIGWRFINPRMRTRYGTDSMPETAQNLADDMQIDRDEQDAFALASQQKAGAAMASGRTAREIMPVAIPVGKGKEVLFDRDEHPRPETTLADLARLRPITRTDGSVTAGNASGVNDGAAALILASSRRQAPWPGADRTDRRWRLFGRYATHYGLRPRAGGAEVAVAGRSHHCRNRSLRTERSLRRAGSRLPEGSWYCGKRFARQS
jgi:acetyl-CoA acetyltransferase family protein